MLRHPLTLLTQAVPPLTLDRATTCLLLQDAHAAFADPEPGWLARHAQAKVLDREFDEYFDTLRLLAPNIERLVDAFRARRIPVLFSCLGNGSDRPPSRFQQATGWEWTLAGPDGDFPASWRPRAGELVFAKPGWGALANPDFARHLDDQRIETVVIAGTMLDFGIRQTCYELADRGIGSLIVSDAVVPLTLAGGAHATGNLAHGLSKLRSTAELLDLLLELDQHGSVVI
ncbi:MAG: cysteine hydrolase [Chloroflexota bacterium]|nr:cysteine hydrolase [Chloroflexota bacterium]